MKVTVAVKEKRDRITLSVDDNGKGISDKEVGSPVSRGVFGIREKAQSLNGTAKIWGRPGKGTSIEVEIPIEP